MNEHELQIPAPYNQYYEFSPNEVNFDELPDAFDHYKDLKVIAELYAKEQYEDALADNCLDFCWLVEDEIGKLLLVTTAGLRVYPITLEEIQDCVDDGSSDNYFDFDEGFTGESSSTELKIPAPYDKYYEIRTTEIPEKEIPTAFKYHDMKPLALVCAKEQYKDALAKDCLDYCYLIDDNGKLELVITRVLRVYSVEISDIEQCVNASVEESFDVREPSSVEYGNFITDYHRNLNAMIDKYDIAKIAENRRYVEYYGVVNEHEFLYTEGKADSGTYAKELHIDGKEVDIYHSGIFHMGIHQVNAFGLMTLIELLEKNDFSTIIFKDDELDDYEESLVEDTEMSDAQRLALQELDSCLEYGELTAEKHALAYQIQWDINFEDILLFINGVDADLKDIKHVEYGDCDETKFDGCYSVTFHNGDVKRYGWHDFDMTGSLTCIDCNESVQSNEEGAYQVYKVGTNGKFTALLKLFDTRHEADEYAATLDVPTKVVYVPQTLIENVEDGWDKPFDWTERYVKDGFVIFNNYQGAWHLEQTRPKTKHIGNYKSLESAKAAGDAEINKRNAKNKDKPVQFGVHSFTSDSIVFRGTEDECAEYINKNGLENEAEIYMMTANDRHYFEESAGKRFNNGDRVYVTVNNRQGNVTKMVSNDVVEVEFEANGTYPARIDRYYVDEVELIDMTPELDEDVGASGSFETNVAKIRDILRKYRNSVRTYDFFGMPQGSKSLPIIYTNKGVKGTTIKACYPDKHFSKDQINKIEQDLRNFVGEDSTIHFDVYDDAWIQGLHTRGYQITVRLQKSQSVETV